MSSTIREQDGGSPTAGRPDVPPLYQRAREMAERVRNESALTRSPLDEKGRLRPISDEELKARAERLARALEEIDQTAGDRDTDEIWREVYRSIDENRPHRPLFKGMY
jgi:hypothetical protein